MMAPRPSDERHTKGDALPRCNALLVSLTALELGVEIENLS